jgi:SAM-dependent methyltransferase
MRSGSILGAVARIIPSPSVNLARGPMLERFRDEVARSPGAQVLVVGAGQQAPELRMTLGEGVDLILSDVDPLADVDVLCDASELPLRDESVQGVIATAVLEHVIYPERVAAEIHRVLVAGGVLYSEIPFVQQVHAGAYDFTRYSLSGHRRLFHEFHEVASGVVAGPGTALVWAIEHFASSFWSGTMSVVTRGLARALFFWLKYFDYVLGDRPGAIDAAACTYFLGTKLPDGVSDRGIIESYRGAKTWYPTE